MQRNRGWFLWMGVLTLVAMLSQSVYAAPPRLKEPCVDYSGRSESNKPDDNYLRVHVQVQTEAGACWDFPWAGILYENRTMVPFRKVLETLGLKVRWNDLDSSVWAVGHYHQAGVGSVQKLLHLQLGNRTLLINGEAQEMDVAPRLFGERTHIPIRFAAQALGAEVTYDEKSRTAILRFPTGFMPEDIGDPEGQAMLYGTKIPGEIADGPFAPPGPSEPPAPSPGPCVNRPGCDTGVAPSGDVSAMHGIPFPPWAKNYDLTKIKSDVMYIAPPAAHKVVGIPYVVEVRCNLSNDDLVTKWSYSEKITNGYTVGVEIPIKVVEAKFGYEHQHERTIGNEDTVTVKPGTAKYLQAVLPYQKIDFTYLIEWQMLRPTSWNPKNWVHVDQMKGAASVYLDTGLRPSFQVREQRLTSTTHCPGY